MSECKNYVLTMIAHSKAGAWNGNTLEVVSHSKNGQLLAVRTSPLDRVLALYKNSAIDPEKEFENAY